MRKEEDDITFMLRKFSSILVTIELPPGSEVVSDFNHPFYKLESKFFC